MEQRTGSSSTSEGKQILLAERRHHHFPFGTGYACFKQNHFYCEVDQLRTKKTLNKNELLWITWPAGNGQHQMCFQEKSHHWDHHRIEGWRMRQSRQVLAMELGLSASHSPWSLCFPAVGSCVPCVSQACQLGIADTHTTADGTGFWSWRQACRISASLDLGWEEVGQCHI